MNRLANELLLAIESRGLDSTGRLALYDDGHLMLDRAVLPASQYVKAGREPIKAVARTVLLHTRFATVGTVNERNAHPVRNGQMAAVHNGTISNHDEVFAEIARKRNAAVDSEVIPAVVHHYGWDKAGKALAKLTGGAATAIVDVKAPGELLLARLSGYPLHVYVTPSVIVWASTRRAIERAWKRTYGSAPSRGEFVEMPEWTMMRVNGSVDVERIPQPKPTPRPRIVFARSTVTPKRKPRRTPMAKQAQMPTRSTPSTGALDLGADTGYVDAEVDALVRLGWDREDAVDLVYGRSLPSGWRDDVVWLDDGAAEWDGGDWSLDDLAPVGDLC